MKKFLKSVGKEAKSFFSSRKVKNTLAIALFMGIATLLCVSADAQVVLPDTGVAVGDYLTAGITLVGGVVAVALGGFIAFLGIRKALRWARTALG